MICRLLADLVCECLIWLRRDGEGAPAANPSPEALGVGKQPDLSGVLGVQHVKQRKVLSVDMDVDGTLSPGQLHSHIGYHKAKLSESTIRR